MNNEELKQRLLDAHNALTDKIGKRPLGEPRVGLNTSGRWYCYANGAETIDDLYSYGHDDPISAVDGVIAQIDALPDPKDRALHEFQKMAAALIDFGNENQIDAKWLNPIVETARALAENAITHVK
jgi:hypothetical protein